MRLKLFIYLSFVVEIIRGFFCIRFFRLLGISIKAKGRFSIASRTRFKIYNKNAKISFGSKSYIRSNCSFVVGEGTLKIGDRFFMNNYSSINCLESIEIGDDCLFGEGVKLYDHNYDYKDTRQIPVNKKGHLKGPIKIGDNCWLGSNTTVLMNVTIGNNVIIGANNLVFKDIPDNTIVVAKQEVITRSYMEGF